LRSVAVWGETWRGAPIIRTPLEFNILGPLEVRSGGVLLSVGGVRQRSLLALLLLNANRVVSR
jgi:hypothetical protein